MQLLKLSTVVLTAAISLASGSPVAKREIATCTYVVTPDGVPNPPPSDPLWSEWNYLIPVHLARTFHGNTTLEGGESTVLGPSTSGAYTIFKAVGIPSYTTAKVVEIVTGWVGEGKKAVQNTALSIPIPDSTLNIQPNTSRSIVYEARQLSLPSILSLHTCMSMASNPTTALPLDVLRQVADILSSDGRRRSVIQQDMRRASLVSHTFAQAFQPHIFHKTFIIGTPSHILKRLQILSSSPNTELGTYVKHLSLTLNGPYSENALPPLLRYFSEIQSLSVLGLGHSSSWTLLSLDFQKSMARLCKRPTLATLSLNQLRGVPAALFASNQSLATVSLSGSAPAFDSRDLGGDISATASVLPLSLNLLDVDLTRYDLPNVLRGARAFFSRVRTLKGTTSWEPERNGSFNEFISLMAGMAKLEHLEVAIDRQYIDGICVPPRQLLESLSSIKKGLKSFTLTTRSPTRFYLEHFVSALPHILTVLDTSHLQTLSLVITALPDYDTRVSNLISALGSSIPGSLDHILTIRQSEGRLGALERVNVTIQVERSEYNQRLDRLRRVVREAVMLPSLPRERVKLVVKSKTGDLIYESSAETQL
ncbi:hypothetical protein NMY22_g5515 [Coprinellus aureogranulatus]|nr:hypothetical protein NMY22_g5515 [Coprinellus aureogranulatus]